MVNSPLTATSLLAETTKLLQNAGYERIRDDHDDGWPTTTRVFEDPYSIVAVLVYETWAELRDTWAIAQGVLTDRISANIGKGDPKAWDGYLALFTAASAGLEGLAVDRIRYDVTRVRKLVATADDLVSLNDVHRVLLPLLPMDIDLEGTMPQSAIDLIPSMLAEKGISSQFVEAVVDAFRKQEPLIEALHMTRTKE